MYDKSIDTESYEQWSFLEKFKGVNTEFNEEILKAAEEQGVNLRKVFGKAISNTLESGTETREIPLYATYCFSVGKVGNTEDVQLFGMDEPIGCWCKSYLVELGEDFWQIKFAPSVGEHGKSIVNYSKVKLDRSDIKFHEDTGELVDWIKPIDEQMIDVDQLRGHIGRAFMGKKKKRRKKLAEKGYVKIRDEVTRAEHFNSGGTGFHEETWNKKKTRQKEKNGLRVAIRDFNGAADFNRRGAG